MINIKGLTTCVIVWLPLITSGHLNAPCTHLSWIIYCIFIFHKTANLWGTKCSPLFNFECCPIWHEYTMYNEIRICSGLAWSIKSSTTTRIGQVNGGRRSNIQYTMWRWRELWSNLLWASMWWTQDICRVWRKEVSQTLPQRNLVRQLLNCIFLPRCYWTIGTKHICVYLANKLL